MKFVVTLNVDLSTLLEKADIHAKDINLKELIIGFIHNEPYGIKVTNMEEVE